MEDSRILNDKILIFICRKTIEIPISEEDSYEKNVVMYVVIGEPRHIAGNLIFFSQMFLLTSHTKRFDLHFSQLFKSNSNFEFLC